MSSTSEPSVSATPGVPLSQTSRVLDTFVSPTRTFEDIRRSASWWLPFVLLLISGLGFGYVLDRQVGFDRIVDNQIKLSPSAQDRMNQLPPEQKTPALARQAVVTRYLTYGFVVPVMAFFALYGLVLWAAFNFGLGAQTRYPQVFAVIFYAALPYLVRTIVTVLILYFGNDAESFDLKNPVGSNPAFYLPDAAPWVKALLQRIDLFELWVLALTILGMAVISRKTVMQSAMIVGGLYVLATVAALGFAAAFA